jgi:flavin-dependent dehydrogenase
MGFDPLCGDGVGNAAREAILAAAVIRAASEGAEVEGVVHHYRRRLLAAFGTHLEICRKFYQAGRGLWWDQQVAQILRGLEWTNQLLVKLPPFRYRLNGFSLERL